MARDTCTLCQCTGTACKCTGTVISRCVYICCTVTVPGESRPGVQTDWQLSLLWVTVTVEPWSETPRCPAADAAAAVHWPRAGGAAARQVRASEPLNSGLPAVNGGGRAASEPLSHGRGASGFTNLPSLPSAGVTWGCSTSASPRLARDEGCMRRGIYGDTKGDVERITPGEKMNGKLYSDLTLRI